MPRITKPQLYKKLEEIKKLMLARQVFAPALYALYQALALQARHEQIIASYRFALLYADKQQKQLLAHPCVLQALLMGGYIPQAQRMAQQLLKQNPADKETRKLLLSLHTRQESQLPPFTAVAELSPYAANPLHKAKTAQQAVPAKWRQVQVLFDAGNLQRIGYFHTRQKLARLSRTYQKTLLDIFDELTASYLLKNYRSVAVLAGALLEILLILHLWQKLGKKKLALNERKPQNLADLNLKDLIDLCAQNDLLNKHLLHLTRVARNQRNFIHPGKELTAKAALTPAGARLCFLTVQEVADAL